MISYKTSDIMGTGNWSGFDTKLWALPMNHLLLGTSEPSTQCYLILINVVAPLIILFIIYLAWLKPVDLKMDLAEIGYRHLKDGTYQTVENYKKNHRDLVRIAQQRRNVGNMPPVYPNGWFALLESDHVPVGEVRHVAALGENFAVFRSSKGEAHILDAYCPHLGANMAIGGKVYDDCLECPFHKWRFSGSTGACTSVPYSSGAPPSAKSKRWPCREVNHFIFVWYHAEGVDPYWHIESKREIETREWHFHGRTDMVTSCHIQDLQENGADVGHLDAIHGPSVLGGVDVRHTEGKKYQFLRHLWDAKWETSVDEKHKGLLALSSHMKLFGTMTLFKITADVEQIGPGYVELNLHTPWGPVLLLMAVTPLEPLLQRVVHRIYSPSLTAPLTKILLYMETIMVHRDIMMWNHKKYELKPHLVKEDKNIVRHRRWFHQFYSENSRRYGYQKDSLECEPGEPCNNETKKCMKNQCSCSEDEVLINVPLKDISKENPALRPAIEQSNRAYTAAVAECANTIQCISFSADQNQRKNTKNLEERAKEIAHERGDIQALISKLRDETFLLDSLRKRVERALTALQIPEAINIECQTRRSSRVGYDMVSDPVDASLFQEQQLCQDIRELLTLTKSEIISQLKSNNVCKVQLEFDWSDKHEAYELEAINIGLKANGPIAFFPGATRLPANQSSPEHWIHYTKELVCQGNEVMEKSQTLRARTEDSLSRSATDLRAQANVVHLEMNKNISLTEHALQAAEQNLTKILGEITIAETLHGKLENMARQVDLNMKISQTRLHHRSNRPRAEQTRDFIQYNLIGEVAHLNENGCEIKHDMENAETALQLLFKSRAVLEDTIFVKRKSLYIDRDRCLPLRNKFPDSINLSGF